MSLLTAYHLHIIHVQHPHRALPYAMGTSGGPASLPYYPAAFLTIDSTKTTPRNASPRCLFRGATLLLVLQFPQFPGHAHPDLAAFGRIPADHAIPVLVVSPPPAGVRVGEARVHARPVAQARAADEPGSGGRSEMGTRPGIGKRDVLPPPRPRRHPRPQAVA